MARLNFECPGNCASCEALAKGEVSMIPCILDQIFQNQRRLQAQVATLTETVEELKLNLSVSALSSVSLENIEGE